MAQTLVNIRMDEEIKKKPSEASVDPFYSESNIGISVQRRGSA